MQSASLCDPKLRVFPFWISPGNPASRLCSSSQLREANQHCNLLFLTAEFSEQKAEFSSAHSHSGQIQPVLPLCLPPSLLLHRLLHLPHHRKAVCGSRAWFPCLGTQLQLAVVKLTFTAMKLCYRRFIEITQSNRVKPFLYGNHFLPSNFIGKNSLIEPPS